MKILNVIRSRHWAIWAQVCIYVSVSDTHLYGKDLPECPPWRRPYWVLVTPLHPKDCDPVTSNFSSTEIIASLQKITYTFNSHHMNIQIMFGWSTRVLGHDGVKEWRHYIFWPQMMGHSISLNGWMFTTSAKGEGELGEGKVEALIISVKQRWVAICLEIKIPKSTSQTMN